MLHVSIVVYGSIPPTALRSTNVFMILSNKISMAHLNHSSKLFVPHVITTIMPSIYVVTIVQRCASVAWKVHQGRAKENHFLLQNQHSKILHYEYILVLRMSTFLTSRLFDGLEPSTNKTLIFYNFCIQSSTTSRMWCVGSLWNANDKHLEHHQSRPTTPFLVYSVTYYLELCNNIICFYRIYTNLPSKKFVIVLWCPNNQFDLCS